MLFLLWLSRSVFISQALIPFIVTFIPVFRTGSSIRSPFDFIGAVSADKFKRASVDGAFVGSNDVRFDVNFLRGHVQWPEWF